MSHNVGDIVNGHVLGSDNQWHPVASDATTTMLEPPQPQAEAAKTKPFYRRWWFIGATGVAAIAIIATATGGKGSSTSASGSNEAAAPAPAAAAAAAAVAGLNTPVRDGKFEFTVTNVDCGKAQIGGQYINKNAQGQFCLVSMNVSNIGTVAQLFDATSQKAIDQQGRELKADSSSVMYIEDSKSFLEQINPGNTVKGVIAFDIPKTSKITQLQLHDSMFSAGTKVQVS